MNTSHAERALDIIGAEITGMTRVVAARRARDAARSHLYDVKAVHNAEFAAIEQKFIEDSALAEEVDAAFCDGNLCDITCRSPHEIRAAAIEASWAKVNLAEMVLTRAEHALESALEVLRDTEGAALDKAA